MSASRRSFLSFLAKLAVLAPAAGWPAGRVGASGTAAWSARRARSEDAHQIAAVFNVHLKAGICPYSDLVESWTAGDAASYLTTFNGTQLVERDGVAVAFGALIDYANPETTSELAAGVEPELGVVALDVNRLAATELVTAAKHLAGAIARELKRQGFSRCQMRMPAAPVLSSNEWYLRHRQVVRVRKRDGVDYAAEVSFDVDGGLAALAAEGY